MVGNGNKKYILIFFGFFLPPSRPPGPNFYPKMPIFLKIFSNVLFVTFLYQMRVYMRENGFKKISKIDLHSKRVIFTPVYKNSLKKTLKIQVFSSLASDISN